jgi:predicted esterase YcpF (UPF0227 family)
MTTLVYLHGFLSSPLSGKAQQTIAWMQQHGRAEQLICPQIPMHPRQAIEQLSQLIAPLDGDFCAVGSSLGGFFATWAVEEFGGRAVLINPAVQPYALINEYLGPQQNYQTGEVHFIDASFAEELREYERKPTQLERYWLLSQTEDDAAKPSSRAAIIVLLALPSGCQKFGTLRTNPFPPRNKYDHTPKWHFASCIE